MHNPRMSRRGIVLTVALAVAALLAPGRASTQDAGFKVVANPSVAGATISKAVLADIFLGRVAQWGDGKPISAVDQSLTSEVRKQFSDKVLGQTTMAVNHHWMREIASVRGKRPPIVKNSDAEVLQHVARHPGAVGYVAASATVPATVKVFALQ